MALLWLLIGWGEPSSSPQAAIVRGEPSDSPGCFMCGESQAALPRLLVVRSKPNGSPLGTAHRPNTNTAVITDWCLIGAHNLTTRGSFST